MPKAKAKKTKTTARKAVKRPVAKKKAPAKRKAPARKVAKKKVAAKKAAPVKPKKLSPVKVKPMTKGEIVKVVAEQRGMNVKEVKAVIEGLTDVIEAHMKKGAVMVCNLPWVKLTVTRKPATKARKGINPFTGEETMFKAKPARNVVKARVLKAIKDMV